MTTLLLPVLVRSRSRPSCRRSAGTSGRSPPCRSPRRSSTPCSSLRVLFAAISEPWVGPFASSSAPIPGSACCSDSSSSSRYERHLRSQGATARQATGPPRGLAPGRLCQRLGRGRRQQRPHAPDLLGMFLVALYGAFTRRRGRERIAQKRSSSAGERLPDDPRPGDVPRARATPRSAPRWRWAPPRPRSWRSR